MDKKVLKKQYAQTVQPIGVYCVKNLLNGKIFIAGGLNVKGKINSCRFQLMHGSHMNRTLQADFNQTGAEHFTFEILDYLNPKDDPKTDYRDDLKLLEDMWIEKLQPFEPNGYHKKPEF